jgi:hypothetical protein
VNRYATTRLADFGVAFRAGKLPLERRERGDHIGRFERSVAASDGDLPKDPCLDESLDRLVGWLVRTADQLCRTVDGEHRRAGEGGKQELRRRAGGDLDGG